MARMLTESGGTTRRPLSPLAGATLPTTFAAPEGAVEAARTAGSVPTVPSQRPRGRRRAVPAAPLGSITLETTRTVPGTLTCAECDSAELTHLRLTLTDGSPVVFVSCHACEHKGWFAVGGAGEALSLESVLGSSAKVR
ncbi:hypothetical protein [Pengzhenrongella sicca]|uniref:TFIIS-type domain-containing protein n=1 Tax=Pengzhenrongella sicca TaxID=2819238 RepID=A0A8A4ZE44_9MICO|nr:hypothetical protein [Pengzhenrongella sicca]QTE30260.1 hypothetical protein J4E96_04430 [Pengzhenrongella sicca]